MAHDAYTATEFSVDLTWESVSDILGLLEDGVISRRKAHEAISERLAGIEPTLPALDYVSEFSPDDMPGEVVRELRMEVNLLREALKKVNDDPWDSLAAQADIRAFIRDTLMRPALELLRQRDEGTTAFHERETDEFCGQITRRDEQIAELTGKIAQSDLWRTELERRERSYLSELDDYAKTTERLNRAVRTMRESSVLDQARLRAEGRKEGLLQAAAECRRDGHTVLAAELEATVLETKEAE
jgi:hypothetical protein